MDIKIYWDTKIVEWEDSLDKKKHVSFIERLAANFRKPLLVRSDICLNLIAPHVKGKEILELGCGSGYFSAKLYQKAAPRRITGIDISEKAVGRARQIAERVDGLKKISEFKVADIGNVELPPADITIGLGLLDYLTKEEIADLFSRVKSNLFLFTFSEKKLCLSRYIHLMYLKSQRCPKHYYYTKKEISECCKRYFQHYYVNHRNLSFGCIVHNLPDEKHI